MIKDLNNIVAEYTVEIPTKIRDWVGNVSIYHLSDNPAAIHLLEEHIDEVDWDWLSENPAAMHILEAYPDNINWEHLSCNPNY